MTELFTFNHQKHVHTKLTVSKFPLEKTFAIQSISAGYYDSDLRFVILTKSGLCYGYGDIFGLAGKEGTDFKHLKLIDLPERMVQVVSGHSNVLFLSETGKVYLRGNFASSASELTQLPLTAATESTEVPKAVKIAKGRTVGCIVTDEPVNNWRSFGTNQHFELGGPETGLVEPRKPVRVNYPEKVKIVDAACGECSTLLVTATGELIGYGWNGYGQLGRHTAEKIPISDINVNFRAASVFNAGSYTMVLSTTGELYSAGWNDYGQCGTGVKSRDVSRFTRVLNISAGDVRGMALAFSNAFILLRNGKVKCCGESFTSCPALLSSNSIDELLATKDVLLVAATNQMMIMAVGNLCCSLFQGKSMTTVQALYSGFSDIVIIHH